jgi:hypothetical protein
MYKLTNGTTIIRLSDDAWIPTDNQSRQYQEYLAWVAAGNTPEPVPQPTQPTKAEQIAKLFTEYDKDRKQLERYLVDAIGLYQDTQYADDLRTEITALDNKYFTDMEAIINA